MKKRERTNRSGLDEQVLPGFEPLAVLWEGKDALFRSEQSVRWQLRTHESRLASAQAVALLNGRLYVHRDRFLAVLREHALSYRERRPLVSGDIGEADKASSGSREVTVINHKGEVFRFADDELRAVEKQLGKIPPASEYKNDPIKYHVTDWPEDSGFIRLQLHGAEFVTTAKLSVKDALRLIALLTAVLRAMP